MAIISQFSKMVLASQTERVSGTHCGLQTTFWESWTGREFKLMALMCVISALGKLTIQMGQDWKTENEVGLRIWILTDCPLWSLSSNPGLKSPACMSYISLSLCSWVAMLDSHGGCKAHELSRQTDLCWHPTPTLRCKLQLSHPW